MIEIREFRPWRDALMGWVTVEEMLRAAAAKRCSGPDIEAGRKQAAIERKDVERFELNL